MLEKAGMPKEVLQLIREVIPHDCARCKQFAHAKHRPRVKTLMGKHFNHIVQCDLFFLWDLIFVLLIDETTRYTFVGHVKSKSFEDLRDCLLQGWFRYVGPPNIFLSDQESSLAGEDFGRLCDKFNVERWLSGSDPHHLGHG